jgi:FMN phosphatase YigB (HAD superfamily)
MEIGRDEAVFVGDTPEIDVIGAQGVGLDVIWIDHGTSSMPVGSFPPTKRVTEFPAILHWL